MEKYSLEWWKALHQASEALGKLDALQAFDVLTTQLFADEDNDDAIVMTYPALQWFNGGAESA